LGRCCIIKVGKRFTSVVSFKNGKVRPDFFDWEGRTHQRIIRKTGKMDNLVFEKWETTIMKLHHTKMLKLRNVRGVFQTKPNGLDR
jgi:hypothetical protein